MATSWAPTRCSSRLFYLRRVPRAVEAHLNPSDLTELVQRLASIGLEDKDAQLYIHLCVNGPNKASEIAAGTKLNRTEAYRALDNLIRRGFVTASLDRPTL